MVSKQEESEQKVRAEERRAGVISLWLQKMQKVLMRKTIFVKTLFSYGYQKIHHLVTISDPAEKTA
jgi:hypothetical protein